MKKTIVCVFAHPDDESFGAGGTISLLSEQYDIYSVCLTDGDAIVGDAVSEEIGGEHLGKIRQEEMKKAAGILGIKDVFFLPFHDGTLCNNQYAEIAEKVKMTIEPLRPEILITFEPRGLSGHIDHIVASSVTHFVAPKVASVEEIWGCCLPKEAAAEVKDYFVYFPGGYDRKEIGKVVDIRSVWETKIKAIIAHSSQVRDGAQTIEEEQRFPKEEYFLVEKISH